MVGNTGQGHGERSREVTHASLAVAQRFQQSAASKVRQRSVCAVEIGMVNHLVVAYGRRFGVGVGNCVPMTNRLLRSAETCAAARILESYCTSAYLVSQSSKGDSLAFVRNGTCGGRRISVSVSNECGRCWRYLLHAARRLQVGGGMWHVDGPSALAHFGFAVPRSSERRGFCVRHDVCGNHELSVCWGAEPFCVADVRCTR